MLTVPNALMDTSLKEENVDNVLQTVLNVDLPPEVMVTLEPVPNVMLNIS